MWTREGDLPQDHLGKSLALFPDIDGDGVSDVVVGTNGGGALRVLSGATASDLLSLPACPLSSSYFGSALGGSAALGATRGLPALLVGDDHASPEGRLYGGRILVISPWSLLSRFGN